MTLGERLRDLRINGAPYRRMREVASVVGSDFPRWSRIEADYEQPTVDEVARAAALLNGDLGELLRLHAEWEAAPPPDPSRNICRKVWH